MDIRAENAVVSVDDNAGALTVDWAGTAPPIGAGLEATALRVTVATDSTGVISVDDNAGSLTVDVGTALPAGANNIGDVDVLTLPAITIAAAQTLATVTTVGAVTGITNALPAGTNAIGKLAANSGVDIGDVDILSIAAGDNNIGNVDVVTLPALVAGTAAIGTVLPNISDLSGTAAYTKKYYTSAGAVTDGIIWSPAASTRWYVTTLIISISAAATVTIEDDLVAGDSAVAKFEFAANSGIVATFSPPLFSGEDAADLLITTSAGNVYVTAVGYEI